MNFRTILPVSILLLCASLSTSAQSSKNADIVIIQRDGVHIEALQKVLDMTESEVQVLWSDFIQHRKDMSPSIQGLKAKESLTAHHSTITRAGNGSLELEMMVMGVDDESSIIRLYAKSDQESAYPIEMESDTQETLDTLLQDFIDYAESQSMQVEETK